MSLSEQSKKGKRARFPFLAYAAGGGAERAACERGVPFPVSWTVKMKKKQKETQEMCIRDRMNRIQKS